MDEAIELWLGAWKSWMNMALSTGVSNLSTNTRGYIWQWSLDADSLGFSGSARLAKALCSGHLSTDQQLSNFQQLSSEIRNSELFISSAIYST